MVWNQYDARLIYTPRRAWFKDTATIRNGQVLHFDTAATASADRASKVTKCLLANIDAPAGIVVNCPGGSKTGPCFVDLIPIDALKREEIGVYTDENVVAGDLLGSVPSSYTLGRAVVGKPYFKARETVNRSVTNGLVYGRLGEMDWNEDPSHLHRWFDDFRDPIIPGVVAGALASHRYFLKGTTAIWALATAGSTPAGTGIGEGNLLGTTTTEAQIQQIGAQYLLSAGRSIFVRQRVKIDDISDEDWFFGLGTPPTESGGVLTGVSQISSGGTAPAGTDYIGFYLDGSGFAGVPKINLRKASGTEQPTTTGVAMVNDTYIDLAFLARNRLTGTTAGYKTVYAFVNGVLVASLETATMAAAFPDTVPLAWAMAGITGACLGTIDRLEINYNR